MRKNKKRTQIQISISLKQSRKDAQSAEEHRADERRPDNFEIEVDQHDDDSDDEGETSPSSGCPHGSCPGKQSSSSGRSGMWAAGAGALAQVISSFFVGIRLLLDVIDRWRT